MNLFCQTVFIVTWACFWIQDAKIIWLFSKYFTYDINVLAGKIVFIKFGNLKFWKSRSNDQPHAVKHNCQTKMWQVTINKQLINTSLIKRQQTNRKLLSCHLKSCCLNNPADLIQHTIMSILVKILISISLLMFHLLTALDYWCSIP